MAAIGVFFVAALFSICARLVTKYATAYRLARDDKLIMMGQVVYLGQCISVSMAASYGVGKPSASLTSDEVDNFLKCTIKLKAEYASIPLLLSTLALIKWSNSAFIEQLSPHNQSVILAVDILIGLCYRANLRQRAWWMSTTIFSMIIDFSLVASIFLIIAKLRAPPIKKAAVLTIFSTRLVAAATQLVVPYLRPFMHNLESGIVHVENVSGSEEEYPLSARPLRQSG
ncbi:hypothetical protein F5Y13DRAFT_180405 [Hypoxylon sp. FL1857]|nr:hypothetical protein F5Y13DRAFT_180405 [Hypoxylon sp. FL1857]